MVHLYTAPWPSAVLPDQILRFGRSEQQRRKDKLAADSTHAEDGSDGSPVLFPSAEQTRGERGSRSPDLPGTKEAGSA